MTSPALAAMQRFREDLYQRLQEGQTLLEVAQKDGMHWMFVKNTVLQHCDETNKPIPENWFGIPEVNHA